MTSIDDLLGGAPPQQQQQQQQPAQPAFDWAGAIANAEVFDSHPPYIQAGVFVLEVTKIKHVPRDGGVTAVAGEFKIRQSSRADMPVGSECSFLRDVPGKKKMGARDIKAFLMAVVRSKLVASGQQPDPNMTFDPRVTHAAISPAQPFAGTLVICQATDVPQKNDSTKSFTRLAWKPATEADLAAPAPNPETSAPPPGWPSGMPWPPAGS